MSSRRLPRRPKRQTGKKKRASPSSSKASDVVIAATLPSVDRASPAGAVATVRVVGVGASAGGLDAFTDLLSGLPDRTGLAFVFVQHLDPNHASLLTEILNRVATIPVQEVTDGTRIEPDHVYVIPPNREMTISKGILRLVPRSSEVPHRPVDRFFRSLADDQKGSAIGVVLSGTFTDGAEGLQAIKDAGGTTFAQDIETAKFDGMPRASTAAADFVLSPQEIAREVVKLAQRRVVPAVTPPGTDAVDDAPQVGEDPQAFDRILKLLGRKRDLDVGEYKRPSVHRRILRRVLIGGMDSLADYADSLEQNDSELETLYQDILIGVTAFFREPARFEALQTDVYPELVKNRSGGNLIRIWVPGCSTGEEVYSLAISLLEFLGDRQDAPGVSIFGTDINEKRLEKARAGFYADRLVGDVSEERRRRFFSRKQGGYTISKSIRDLCVFARHDVTRDPPFSRIDLISCCNVLIYLGSALQKKAIPFLHYALVPDGFLALGSSENVGAFSNLFTPVGKKSLIYKKRAVPGRGTADFDLTRQRTKTLASPPTVKRSAEIDSGVDPESALVSHLVQAGVLVNEEMEITRFRGDLSSYLRFVPGEATFDLFKMIRHDDVRSELRTALRRAARDGTPVKRKQILRSDRSPGAALTFQVIPYKSAAAGPSLFWVLFRDLADRSAPKPKGKSGKAGKSEISDAARLREELGAVIEDRQRLIEEAAGAAEEAQSSDEELRSANEELETAKEELESGNEELNTLNDELRNRNAALTRLNDDLENLLAAVEIPILFVGTDLRLRRFNATAGTLLNLAANHVGQPLSGVKSRIEISNLGRLTTDVVETQAPADVEVQDADGKWYLLRIRPYHSSDSGVDGAIIALVDIDTLKRSVTVAEDATSRATMLAQAGGLLASSLDYEATLESVTRLSTPAFADWCAVDLVNEDGSIRHLAVSHANPFMHDLAAKFQEEAFAEPEAQAGAPLALRSRKPVLVPEVAELPGLTPDAKLTQLVEALGVKSLLSVPLLARDKVLGTMTFSSSTHQYDAADLLFAEELGRRAATAIDTAVLFREAEIANRYKDVFLGTVAHELRTPLTSIMGWVQLARSRPRDNEMRRDALVQIEQSANLLRIFIEDLLDMTRIRERKLRLNLGEVDFAATALSAIEMTRFNAKAKGIEVKSQFTLSPAPVKGDSVRLMQVVWNLLSNAIKFTPPAGEIEVRLEPDGDEARLSVRDTGEGIPGELQPYVFEPFRQAEDSGQRTSGLGIGLSIVKQIVTLHGGSVGVESPGPGRGSTFTVRLPLHRPEVTDNVRSDDALELSGRRTPDPRRVEDR